MKSTKIYRDIHSKRLGHWAFTSCLGILIV